MNRMMRCAAVVLAGGFAVTFLGALAAEVGAVEKPAATGAGGGKQGGWVEVSGPTLKKLEEAKEKFGYPGGTAGVTVDPATGDVYMVVAGLGIWKSTDQGKTFGRVDDGAIGGRCETSYALEFDPAGKRLACFMLDGKCGMTADGGKTWTAFTGLGRNWDYAAVDWSGDGAAGGVKNIFGARHENGGDVYYSNDAGKTWTMLFKNGEFEKSGGLGIFDEKTLVYTMKGEGIMRSTDAGKTFAKVSDLQPWGRVVRVYKGTGYWLSKDGILVSKDKGATWAKQGSAVEASVGPYFDLKNDKHMAAAGPKGLYETMDAGETWKMVGALPAKFDIPKPGWFTNVGWDAERGIFYASKMGNPTFKLETGK